MPDGATPPLAATGPPDRGVAESRTLGEVLLPPTGHSETMADGPHGRLALAAGAALVVAGLVVGLALAGGDGSASQPAIGENASARLADLDGLAATRETVVRHDGSASRTVERVTVDPDAGAVRAAVREGPGSTDLRVSNGSTLWLYDRENATAERIDLSEPAAGNALDRIPRLFERLNRAADAPTEGTSVSVSPLPVVPAAGDRGRPATGPVGRDDGAYRLTYEGTETVDGREARVLSIGAAGAGEPAANYTQTLWLDADRYYPLRQRTAWTQGGDRTVVTTTLRNVTVDPGIDADAFRFEPPAGATVEEVETPDRRRYGSVGALREAAEMTVPRVDLPDSFALAEATRTEGRVTSVGLRYVNATGVLTVAKITPAYAPYSEGETVSLGDREATYRDTGGRRTVFWSTDDVQYKVSGRGLPRAVVIEAARSVADG